MFFNFECLLKIYCFPFVSVLAIELQIFDLHSSINIIIKEVGFSVNFLTLCHVCLAFYLIIINSAISFIYCLSACMVVEMVVLYFCIHETKKKKTSKMFCTTKGHNITFFL